MRFRDVFIDALFLIVAIALGVVGVCIGVPKGRPYVWSMWTLYGIGVCLWAYGASTWTVTVK